MTDVKLTREQIEEWRCYISGDQSDATDKSAQQFNALCDMALQSLADSEDAARYRWLRECQSIPADILHNHHEALDAAIDAARKESRD